MNKIVKIYRYTSAQKPLFIKQCCGTGTGIHSGYGTGFESGSIVKCKKNERPTFWKTIVLLNTDKQDFVQNCVVEKLCLILSGS
jgi:hypothetical protein